VFFVVGKFALKYMGLVLLSVDVLKKTVVDKLPSDLEGLEGTIERLQDMIDTISRYVDNVIVSPEEKMISPHILSAFSLSSF
jgi:hypothetical protein